MIFEFWVYDVGLIKVFGFCNVFEDVVYFIFCDESGD